VNPQNNTSQNDSEIIAYEVAHQDNPLQDVPTTLQFNEGIERGERHSQWSKVETFPIGTKLVFIGCQLQCFDEELTTITPRFFPKMKI
jgi:hypothetical protein